MLSMVWDILIRHGGICDKYKTSRITHFACNNFTDAQLKNIIGKTKIKDYLVTVVATVVSCMADAI